MAARRDAAKYSILLSWLGSGIWYTCETLGFFLTLAVIELL
ncbi:hypothetical protein HMPREF1548_05659 [Clostridium sp. KLE 1755]|nr:hypothetical protein HMPREF1548_05659 [Clostridium sp. KLE 1755]